MHPEKDSKVTFNLAKGPRSVAPDNISVDLTNFKYDVA